MTQTSTDIFKIEVITCVCCLLLPYLLFIITPGGMSPFFSQLLFLDNHGYMHNMEFTWCVLSTQI